MDYEGNTYGVGDISNLQSQIDALDARIVALEARLTLDEITLGAVVAKASSLSNFGAGNFTAFNFTSSLFTNLTASMTPIWGSLRIPLAEMTDGMVLRFRLYTAMQVNPSQDLILYLSQDEKGNYPYTSATNESQPVLIDVVGRIWTFTMIVKKVAANSEVNTIVETGNSRIGYHNAIQPDQLISFTSQDGMDIYVQAKWATPAGVNNFTVKNFTLERIGGFI